MKKKGMLQYKGFLGSVHFSADDDVFFGKIEEIDDLISFEASTVKDLHTSFEEAVEDYLELCKKANKEPLKPAKGSFNVRISPELHRKAIHTSKQMHLNLNQFVQQAIERAITSL